MSATTDGRRLRGIQRRAKIVEATLTVVERDGVAGVTHRTVAAEAGVPPGSVTYHFATLEDLLIAALTSAVDDYAKQLDELSAAGNDPLQGLARLIAETNGAGRRRALAERELTLLAARRPALQNAAGRWRGLVADIAAQWSSDPMAGDALVGVSDAICARILLGDDTMTAEHIHEHLIHAVRS